MADFCEFHQYRAAAAADVLSRGGLPAVAGGVGTADRFRAKRKLRQSHGGNLRQAYRLASSEIRGFNKRQRCRTAISAEWRVSSTRGASDLFQRHGCGQSKQFSALARFVPKPPRICAERNLGPQRNGRRNAWSDENAAR